MNDARKTYKPRQTERRTIDQLDAYERQQTPEKFTWIPQNQMF